MEPRFGNARPLVWQMVGGRQLLQLRRWRWPWTLPGAMQECNSIERFLLIVRHRAALGSFSTPGVSQAWGAALVVVLPPCLVSVTTLATWKLRYYALDPPSPIYCVVTSELMKSMHGLDRIPFGKWRLGSRLINCVAM